VISECSFVDPATGVREEIRYLDVGDTRGRVYLVHDHARGPARGGVVLCGSINADREGCLRTLVDIARALAAEGFDVLRLDYRGIGESTGEFADYCLSDWRHDIESCVAALRARLPGLPVGVWGIRAGALLASEVFSSNLADGALFCAPMHGQAFLQGILRRSLVNDMTTRPNAKRSTRAQIIAVLERGDTFNVDGYAWSKRLWEDAASHRFVIPASNERPWRIVDFTENPATELPADLAGQRVVSTAGRFWEATPTRVARDPTLWQFTKDWMVSLCDSWATRAAVT
jgi:pimeloyl-ACP methyl ester carboxylesterase